MIRLSDYIANFLFEHGLTHVFMMVGGGAMHLNDALGKYSKLNVVFNHHEQACSIAAESYARLLGKPAVLNVTTGPGGINAMTGVFGAYTDSIPMIVLSGQVRYDTTVASTDLPLRQLGDQEIDIVSCVTPITKYAVMVTDPQTIRYHLEKALFLATHGRPGPVWLDIPLNIQAAPIDPSTLLSYDPAADKDIKPIPNVTESNISEIISKINEAKRPVLMVGGGIRVSGIHTQFLELVDAMKIPIVTAWNAHDVVDEDCPYYCGRPGTLGDRAGNFVVQNADLLLVLGSRLNIRQIGYAWNTFAREAYKIMVDVDACELQKPTLKIDMPVIADLKDFIPKMLTELQKEKIADKSDWVKWGRDRKAKYPVVLPEYWQRELLVNPYCFMDTLSEQLPEDQVVVSGNGSACVVSFQTIKIKKGQRLYTNSGCAAMGYDLPAAIGACEALGRKKVVCLAGDGSLQLNIQELAMVFYHKYPLKIFVLNNQGYHSIRQTQTNFFGGDLVGCDEKSGLGFPNLEKLAPAYGLRYAKCDKHKDLTAFVNDVLTGEDPVVAEVMLTIDQPFAPRSSSRRLPNGKMVSKPLEDLAPFLSQEEFLQNMIVKPLKEE